MEYRVSSLAEAAGVAVDTVRFYQARGLLPPPERRGRFAIYGADHLQRLRRIRGLLDAGFRLAQIRQLLEGKADDGPSADASRGVPPPEEGLDERSLLAALAGRRAGSDTLSRCELASETGVPEALIAASIQAGLLRPIEVEGEERFPRSDLEMLDAALEILGLGLPLDRLLELGAMHAKHVDRLADRAIDLFDDAIRKPGGADDARVRRAFEKLLPQATRVVALHFQRAVVARALERLRASGGARPLEVALEEALEASHSGRLEVSWR